MVAVTPATVCYPTPDSANFPSQAAGDGWTTQQVNGGQSS